MRRDQTVFEEIDAKLAKGERAEITRELIRAFLSDSTAATTENLVDLVEAFADGGAGSGLFPRWRRKQFQSLVSAAVKALAKNKEVRLEGRGRGRRIKLRTQPVWTSGRAGKLLAKAKAKVRQEVMSVLANAPGRPLLRLVEVLADDLQKDLSLPAVGFNEAVSEFGIVFHIVQELIAEKVCFAARVDDPDGDGKLVELRLVQNGEGTPKGNKKSKAGRAGATNGAAGSTGVGEQQSIKAEPAPAGTPSTATIVVTMIAVGLLRPSEFNPNVMSEEAFHDFVHEVKQTKRIPKPVVVRPHGTSYQIIDGQHTWLAAKKCGFTEVPCQILDLGDYDALRETHQRTRHGSNDPLKLGRMFRQMMVVQGLSQRALGKELDIPEPTIRTFLAYAEAADVRNGYAHPKGIKPEEVDRQVAKLTVKQVQNYRALPDDMRDGWFDAGCQLREAERIKAQVNAAAGADAQAAVPAAAQQVPPVAVVVPVAPPNNDTPIPAEAGPPKIVAETNAAVDVAGIAPAEPNSPPTFMEALAAATQRKMVDDLMAAWGKANDQARRAFVAARLIQEPELTAFLRRTLKTQ
jgi:ParB-like chromosome segregation protein Spo0J